MSLLIRAIPQWPGVCITCPETMWPESGEKLNAVLGESQGLSANLDGLCSLLPRPAQRSLSPPPTPERLGGGLRIHSSHATIQRTAVSLQPPFTGRRAGVRHPWALQVAKASSRHQGLPGPGPWPAEQTRGRAPASADDRQAQPHRWVCLRWAAVGRILFFNLLR